MISLLSMTVLLGSAHGAPPSEGLRGEGAVLERLSCQGDAAALLPQIDASLAHNGWVPVDSPVSWPQRSATVQVGKGSGVLVLRSWGRMVTEDRAPGMEGSQVEGLQGLVGVGTDLGVPCTAEWIPADQGRSPDAMRWELPQGWGTVPEPASVGRHWRKPSEELTWTHRTYARVVVDARPGPADSMVLSLLGEGEPEPPATRSGVSALWPGVLRLTKARTEAWLRLWWSCEEPECPLGDPLAGDVVLGEHVVARPVATSLTPRQGEESPLTRSRWILDLSPEIRERLRR